MTKPWKTALAAGLVLALGGCSGGEKETVGSIIGAGIGGLAGSQVGKGTGQLAAVGVGALIGAMIGGELGRNLDEADRVLAERNYQETLETIPTGTTTTWENPDTGVSGTHTPIHTEQTETGQYCREFQQTITIGGQTEEAYGRACRQPDGTWMIVDA